MRGRYLLNVQGQQFRASFLVRWGAGAGWLLLGIFLAAAFANTFSEMWLRWFPAWTRTDLSLYSRLVEGEGYYTHGPVIPLVSLVLAWLLLRHTAVTVRPARAAGFVVLAAGLLLHLAGSLVRVNFVSGFSLIAVLAGLVLLLWGAAALRRIWFPLALLAFMVPLPEVLIADANFRLKMLAADWGVHLAGLLGIAVERTGNQVMLPGGKSMIVANACNGLRTLISLMAFAALYAYVCRLRGTWRVLLFLAAVPMALAANALRIASLIVVADIWDERVASGWYHDLSGALVFVVAFLLMFGIEQLVLGVRKIVGRPATIVPLLRNWPRREDPAQGRLLRQAAGTLPAFVAALLVAAGAAGAWQLSQAKPSTLTTTQLENLLPRTLVIQGRAMNSESFTLDARTLTILENPSYLLRRYESADSVPLDVCLVVSRDNRKGIHSPDLCIEGGGSEIVFKADVDLPSAGRPETIPCRELVVQDREGGVYFLYTYKCGGYTRSFWGQQWGMAVNAIRNKPASGALVRISTPASDGLGSARQRAAQLMQIVVGSLDKNLP